MQKPQWIKGPDFVRQTDRLPQLDSYENEVDHNAPDSATVKNTKTF